MRAIHPNMMSNQTELTGTLKMSERLLIIKLGALGDFILAFGAMKRIRATYPKAHITLLTAAPFATLIEGSGWIDQIWIDPKPSWRSLGKWWAIRRMIRGGRFTRVYDLQNNDRTACYFRLCGPFGRPEWSGLVQGCSLQFSPPTPLTHAFDWPTTQLVQAGLEPPEPPDASWMGGDVDHLSLPENFVLLVPGCAPHRPEKRWPAASYLALARRLAMRGLTPVLIGTQSEADVNRMIAQECPQALDVTGQTRLLDLATLGRRARGAVGNDTGPMHLIAPSGCPTVVLFSAASNHQTCRPLGPIVRTLHRSSLADLAVEDVENELMSATR
ncbi:ADP-heptose--LPS heptosyltransferase [Azospirillaceae bacterium]